MRRIILAILTLTLTACGRPAEDVPGRTGEPDPGSDAATVERAEPATTAARTNRDDSAATILFVGTSLTAGYGVGAEQAYPAVLQQKIDSAGLRYRVVNAGISGETSAGGLRRIDWSLQQPTDVLVVELGANDGLRGLDPAAMRSNLDGILARARELHPDVAIVVIGMEAPPNLGTDYGARFRNVFTDIARQYDAALVPFLLDGVAADPALNLDDGIHPNAEGHRILARTVWEVLGPVLAARVADG
ncbi:MAG TPA: arylesterase [Longimicrobiales bacterium]|nr:arylesterase [Longimicrobiales bacterium]